MEQMIRNIINDMGNIALALLANDKYRAVSDPVEYMGSDKYPIRNLAVALMCVVPTTAIRFVGEVLWQHGVTTQLSMIYTWGFSDAIRAVYLFFCLYM